MRLTLTAPAEIMIAGKRWRILKEGQEPPYLRRKRSMRERGVMGVTFLRARIIVLAKGLTRWEREETTTHEILHAIFAEVRLRWHSDRREERLVEAIDGPLTSALKQIQVARLAA